MLYLLLVFLKSAVMKTKVIFSLFAAIVLGLNCSFAQVYPSFDDDSYVESVKLKGQKPTIVDFVNNYLSDAEGDLGAHLSDMWDNYKAGKPQEKGMKVIVDVRNGYARFEENYTDANELSVTEMCYWNCSDGKHKILAFSNSLFADGKFVEGQYTGTVFWLYENSTRRLMQIGASEIGAEVESGVEHITSGYDGKNWYYEKGGKKTVLTQEEYDTWYADTHPVIIYHLPQVGKEMKVEFWTPKRVKIKVLTWDGLKFHVPNY